MTDKFDTCHIAKSGAVITPKGRMMFTALDKRFRSAKDKENNRDGCFTVAIVFPPNADLKLLADAAKKVAAEKWPNGDIYRRIPGVTASSGNFKWPIRLCKEVETEEGAPRYDKEYDEWFQVRGVTYRDRPGIVDENGKRIDKAGEMEAIDAVTARIREEAYSGRWARLALAPAAFDNESRGVKFWLNNVQLLAHDDKLGGGVSASPEDDFGAPMAEDGTPAKTSDNLFD